MSSAVPAVAGHGIRIHGHASEEELAAVIVVFGRAGAGTAAPPDPLSQWRAVRLAAVRRSTPARL